MKKQIKIIIFFITLLFPIIASAQFSIYGQYDGLPGNGGQSLDENQISEHANMARCLCDEQNENGEDYSYYWGLQYSGAFDSSYVYFYLGSDCSNTSVSLDQCKDLGSININSFNQVQYIGIPINYVVDPIDGKCSEISSGSKTFYIFSDTESRTSLFDSSISYDTAPPSSPQNLSVTGGENSISVSWEDPTETEDNVKTYNILCMKNTEPSEISSESKATWISTEDVCGKVITLDTVDSTDLDTDFCPDGALVEGGRPYQCYVCGTASTGTTSLRIDGLENGVEYKIAVVAIDQKRNVSEIGEVISATPVQTTDFAEQYKDAGGKANGDYCFIATAVFGGKNHPYVRILRMFRDRFLFTSKIGTSFVRWYYAHGKTWAKFLKKHPITGIVVKLLLFPLVLLSAILLVLPWWGYILFLLFFIALNNFFKKYGKLTHVS